MIDFYHDAKRNLLIYKPVDLDRMLKVIPEAKRVNDLVAVPRTLYNSQLLRWLDYPITPIMDGYDWPCHPSIKPLPHQKVMANFMVTHPRCFNLSDMGTMKTLATLWAADWLMSQFPKGQCHALIVAPLSTLRRVWGDTVFKNFLGRRTFQIVHGSAKQRALQLEQPADFYIINFDGVGLGASTRPKIELRGLSRILADRTDIQIVIVDEASAYRDSRTKRSRIARMVFGERSYVWLLTGTPTPNAPTDAYGLGKLVNNAFGKSFTTFQAQTMIRLSQFKWVPQRDGYEKARELLRPSIRYDIKDVWDGPEMTTQQREVELTDEQVKALTALKRNLALRLESGATIDVVNEAALRLKFLQISLGAVYDADHKAHETGAEPRLQELEDVIEQAPGKLLVFAPLTSVVNMLYSRLHANHACEIVNGNTSQKDRDRIFQDFQQSEQPRILIADPGTMAHGLNLWMAQTVVWYGPTDRTELYLQANKRAHRPGQRYPVTVVQLTSTPLEREIFGRLDRNETMQGLLLQMVREDRL